MPFITDRCDRTIFLAGAKGGAVRLGSNDRVRDFLLPQSGMGRMILPRFRTISDVLYKEIVCTPVTCRKEHVLL